MGSSSGSSTSLSLPLSSYLQGQAKRPGDRAWGQGRVQKLVGMLCPLKPHCQWFNLARAEPPSFAAPPSPLEPLGNLAKDGGQQAGALVLAAQPAGKVGGLDNLDVLL